MVLQSLFFAFLFSQSWHGLRVSEEAELPLNSHPKFFRLASNFSQNEA